MSRKTGFCAGMGRCGWSGRWSRPCRVSLRPGDESFPGGAPGGSMLGRGCPSSWGRFFDLTESLEGVWTDVVLPSSWGL